MPCSTPATSSPRGGYLWPGLLISPGTWFQRSPVPPRPSWTTCPPPCHRRRRAASLTPVRPSEQAGVCETADLLEFGLVWFPAQKQQLLCPAELHGLSDEEGSSEVFLTTDSDYDSSRAQSPRELDLLPSSPCSSAAEPRPFQHEAFGGGALRGSTPDVLQASDAGPPGHAERRRAAELFDSDFILPSRQIELLRITEKKQAFCVRTSSLEFPPVSATSPPATSPQRRWHQHSTMDRCCPPECRPRPAPARTLSEDSGSQTTSAPSPGVCRKPCHVTLRVYPQYRTGLPKETSVKVRVRKPIQHLSVLLSFCRKLR